MAENVVSETLLALLEKPDRYDAAATPSTGTQTLFDHYADLLQGRAETERGDHAVF